VALGRIFARRNTGSDLRATTMTTTVHPPRVRLGTTTIRDVSDSLYEQSGKEKRGSGRIREHFAA